MRMQPAHSPGAAAPIILIGFDRYAYLARVAESVAAQTALGDREVHLFLDGAVNAYSGEKRARKEDLTAACKVFEKYIPHGVIHASNANIGIFENFRRAERYIFEERGFDVAYFLEDDLVLSPHYFTAMDMLWRQLRDNPAIGYFAAYGDHLLNSEQQKAQLRQLAALDHVWAFGLTAKHWRAMQPFLNGYAALVKGRDYRCRNGASIHAYFQRHGVSHEAHSQDAAKMLATNLLNIGRVRTQACWGQYIGVTGTHGNHDFYTAQGFDKTVLQQDAPDPAGFAIPDNATLQRWIDHERFIYADFARHQTTRRLATPDDIRDLYRLLLERMPESRAVVEGYSAATLAEVRRALLTSPEFMDNNAETIARMCGQARPLQWLWRKLRRL